MQCEVLLQVLRGSTFARGESCDELRTLSGYTTFALPTAVALVIVVSAGYSSFWLWKNKKHSYVRAGQPKFLHLMNFGTVLASLSLLFTAISEKSTEACFFAVLMQAAGFMTILAPLVLKTVIIATLFNNKSMKKRKDQRPIAWAYTIALIAAEIILVCTLQGIAPLRPTVLLLEPSVEEWAYAITCRAQGDDGSSIGIAWAMSLAAVNIMMLIWACVSCFRVRNAPDSFAEAKWLGFVVYNMSFVSIIGIPIMLSSKNDPKTMGIVNILCTGIVCLSAIWIMHIPKRYLVSKYAKDANPMVSEHSTNFTGPDDHLQSWRAACRNPILRACEA